VTGDRDAVARFLRRRDEASFLPLFREHTPMLMMLAIRLLGGARADAEDAVQEAWMRAVRALPRFQWRSSLRTWLCGIVVNCCREIRRYVPPGPQAARDPRLDAAVDLERAIAELPDAAREVFVLHEIHGCTHEEVGRILGIEAGTSKSQLHDARRALRRFLGDYDEQV
jgi:RNA polymerase sigma-70 factor (ECF subfamily)